jgi:hypothetical protein
MTIENARDEFYQQLNDDQDFSDCYEKNEAGFLAWLNDYPVLDDDLVYLVTLAAA